MMFDELNETMKTLKNVSETQKIQILNRTSLEITRMCFQFKVTPKEAIKMYREVNKELRK